MTAKEKAKDRRLRKTYGWTLEMYNALGELQEWKCPCGRPLTELANVDHQHFHVQAERIDPKFGINANFPSAKWIAVIVEFEDIVVYSMTRKEAELRARKLALPRSVRGLMCHGRHGRAGSGSCNRLLGRVDNQDWLRCMADYLDNPPAKQILDSVRN